jgi:hypothetical protein
MRRIRIATTLAALPLAAAACGSATAPQSGDGSDHQGSQTSDLPGATRTPPAFAAALLTRVEVPAGAQASTHAPSKVLEHLPAVPASEKPPTVVQRFWTVDSSAKDVIAWLKAHAPADLRFDGSGTSSAEGTTSTAQYLAYRSSSLPRSIALGDIYLAVTATGPNSSAIGAYALSLAQPPRPAAENVPLDVSSATIGWSLAPGGTPVRKELTGSVAQKLARDFNTLRVDVSPMSPCPLMPTRGGDIIVTFRADGHTWRVDVPACPDILVTRDGAKLPSLAFGPAFLRDVRTYVGHLPQSGPPRAGGVIPLVQPPTQH